MLARIFKNPAHRLFACDAQAIRAARLVVVENDVGGCVDVRAAGRHDDVLGLDAEALRRSFAEIEMGSASGRSNPAREPFVHGPFYPGRARDGCRLTVS
jgi:hypothetical protein